MLSKAGKIAGGIYSYRAMGVTCSVFSAQFNLG
jgi:hypothetical protein